MSTPKVFEFKNDIYPFRLWVCITCKDLSDRFYNTAELLGDIAGETTEVHEKATQRNGILIRFTTKADMTMSNIAHEAYHATKAVFHYVGAMDDYEHQEAFAYLLGWVVNCLEQVKTSKNK